MSDEQLRALQRRWHETGAPEDEAAYRRTRARTQPTSGDRIRASLEAYDRQAVRRAVEVHLAERLPALRERPLDRQYPSRWTFEALGELSRALSPLLGAWASTGFRVGDWCACHSWVGYGTSPRDVTVEAAAESYCQRLEREHAFHLRMFALFDRLRFSRADPTALGRELRQAVTQVVGLVVDELTCHDAWYDQPGSVLELLLEEKELPLAPGLDEVFEGAFSSWVAPSEEEVALVADQVALALVRARFEERYGPL